MTDVANILMDLKRIMYNNDTYQNLFWNGIEDTFTKIGVSLELKTSPEILAIAVMQTLHNQFFDTFCLLESMEYLERDDGADQDNYPQNDDGDTVAD